MNDIIPLAVIIGAALVACVGMWTTWRNARRSHREAQATRMDVIVFERLNTHDEAILQLYTEVAALKAKDPHHARE